MEVGEEDARGGHLGVQGVQSIPRSAWVKTDAASRRVSADVACAVLLAASGSYPRDARYILYPCTPPRYPPLEDAIAVLPHGPTVDKPAEPAAKRKKCRTLKIKTGEFNLVIA